MEKNMIFQVGLEVDLISVPQIRPIRWVREELATRGVNEDREVSEFSAERHFIRQSHVQYIGSGGGVVWVCEWSVRSKDQTGVLFGVIT